MRIKSILSFLLLNAFTLGVYAQNIAPKTFKFAERQTRLLLTETEKTKKELNKAELLSPRTLDGKGNLLIVSPNDWCSGFFAGNLWFLYEYTGDKFWKQQSEPYTAVMELEKKNGARTI